MKPGFSYASKYLCYTKYLASLYPIFSIAAMMILYESTSSYL